MAADTANWISIAAPAALIAVLAIAVGKDLVSRRVPNLLTFGALGLGLALAAWGQGLAGVGGALAGAAVGLACLMPLYLAKGMGAGDVKLMAAAGAFLGPFHAFIAAMLTLAAGAVLGIAVLAWRAFENRDATRALVTGPALSEIRKERFPYAAAIAVGVVATLWWRGVSA